MSKSPTAAHLRGAVLAVVASALLAPAAHAAGPVVTGIDAASTFADSELTVTVSGSGFTGATAVYENAKPAASFNVVSDRTIIARFAAGHDVSGPSFVSVTTNEAQSPPNPAAAFTAFVTYPRNASGGGMKCTIGGSGGTSFSAVFGTEFVDINSDAAVAGQPYDLAPFKFSIFMPARRDGRPDPLADVVGDATVTSIEADVFGASPAVVDLAAPGTPFSFPVGTSVDGNALWFAAGSSPAARLDLPATPGPFALRLRAYHARLPLSGGASQALDCVPDFETASLLGLVSRAPDASPSPTPTSTPAPSPTPAAAGVNLALKGSATLKTLAKGSVPLTGSLKGAFTRGAFAGDLALDPATAKLVAYGFLPVTARLTFTQLAPTTGTLSDAGGSALQLTSKVRIKLPSVKVFGLELVAGSPACQAANPTILNLKSPAFNAAGGGSLTGTFAISNLTGCGSLTGIVSPLTAGTGNAITLSATPAAVPAAS